MSTLSYWCWKDGQWEDQAKAFPALDHTVLWQVSSHSVQAAGLNLRPWVMRALGPRQLPLSSKNSLLSEKTLMPSPDFSLFEPSVVPVQGTTFTVVVTPGPG